MLSQQKGMDKVELYKKNLMLSSILSLLIFNTLQAGDVEILSAELHNTGGTHWSVSVTLEHEDTGWDHYADNWQVVDVDGKILGDRVLYHPHVNEQPFTRSLGNVEVPIKTKTVYIRAHDKIHGWTAEALKVNLDKIKGNKIRVEKP